MSADPLNPQPDFSQAHEQVLGSADAGCRVASLLDDPVALALDDSSMSFLSMSFEDILGYPWISSRQLLVNLDCLLC